MFVIVVTSSLTLRYFLVKIGGATPLLDAITVSLGVIATFYEIKRYADQYALWLISDVIAITQWILLGDVIMVTKKSIYFVMSIIGIINWTRMQKERNTENS
jgi:nicotinamide mononucleotide transporter